MLRSAGLLQVREELGLELLDAGASQAFAVADHQIAHVYVNNPAVLPTVKVFLEKTLGVEAVALLNSSMILQNPGRIFKSRSDRFIP